MMNVPELNKKLKENVIPINGLRKFQQNTVRHAVCALAANGSRKFLVADEVGLGKTKVARGVIQNFLAAQAGEPDSGALTVLYLCANQQLAWQNLKSFHHFDMYLKPDEENINSRITFRLWWY